MDKENILLALDKIRQFQGFTPIDVAFKEIGITDHISQEHLLNILFDKNLVTKSSHSRWNIRITELGRRLDSQLYDQLFSESPSAGISVNQSTGDLIIQSGQGSDIVIKSGDVNNGGRSGDINLSTGSNKSSQKSTNVEPSNSLLTTIKNNWWALVVTVIGGVLVLAIQQKWFK